MQPARGTKAGWYGLEEGLDKGIYPGLHHFCPQVAAQQPHTAVNVKAHSTRADDTSLFPEGGHAADGKAIAQVSIGHGHGVLDYAGQGGHIGHLIHRPRLDHIPQGGRDEDSPRHSHARPVAQGHLVSVIIYLAEILAGLFHNHTSRTT